MLNKCSWTESSLPSYKFTNEEMEGILGRGAQSAEHLILEFTQVMIAGSGD